MLQSETQPNRHYAGCTHDLKKRVAEHNAGQSNHTKKFLPWKLLGYSALTDHNKADKFEAYLKTASGKTFAKRHF
jgi:putative endonuclease